MRTRILIIGSGAVGAVYAQHLVRAGCQVNFLVRDENSSNSVMPRPLHQYHFLGKPTVTLQHLRMISKAYPEWDQVWLTLPSDALQSAWLAEQLAVFSADTPLISWSPDFSDDETLSRIYKGPIQHGLIGFISFQTPLPGEHAPEKGFAYLLPPGAALLDNSAAGKHAAALLRSGGLSAKSVGDLPWLSARATALMVPLIAGLELAGWSLSQLRTTPWQGIACEASREAMWIAAAYLDRRPGMMAKLPQPALVSMLTRLAPKVLPLPLESYLQYHFGKVGEQTRQMLDHWIAEGEARSMSVTALQSLRDGLVQEQEHTVRA